MSRKASFNARRLAAFAGIEVQVLGRLAVDRVRHALGAGEAHRVEGREGDCGETEGEHARERPSPRPPKAPHTTTRNGLFALAVTYLPKRVHTLSSWPMCSGRLAKCAHKSLVPSVFTASGACARLPARASTLTVDLRTSVR